MRGAAKEVWYKAAAAAACGGSRGRLLPLPGASVTAPQLTECYVQTGGDGAPWRYTLTRNILVSKYLSDARSALVKIISDLMTYA